MGNYNIIKGNDVSIDDFNPRTSKSEDGITARGFGNQIIDNMIQNTNKDGIDINFIVSNSVESVQNDAGFNIDTTDCDIGGNRNYLADNMSANNAEAGFKIEETNNNVIVRNTATV